MSYQPWFLKDLKPPSKDAPTVFSCFHCGGGSTMGYKLAGFNVLGGVEIDPKMMEVYRANHNPKHSYLMGVQEFKNIPNDDLPKELFNLDILDGSPPCSSFSMAGSREKAWGEKKKFREGQANQVLDELFFDFIDIAKKLQPKIVVAENVRGLISGNAKYYVKRIHQAFQAAGYDVQLFLLNSAFMGVPQRRERTFFIARRKDLNLDPIKLEFNMKPISVSLAIEDLVDQARFARALSSEVSKVFRWCLENKQPDFAKYYELTTGKRKLFNHRWQRPNEPADTQTSTTRLVHPSEPRYVSNKEAVRIQSFPDDFNFLSQDTVYICGMSVPPRMMEKVALEIRRQWLSKYKIKKALESGS